MAEKSSIVDSPEVSLPIEESQEPTSGEHTNALDIRSEATAGMKQKESEGTPQTRAPRLNVTVKDFTYERLLGMGSYSKVILATYKGDGKEYALKVMAKQLILRERKVKSVKRERLILDQLDHPGIVRMCFTFQDQASLYMAMECCHGGDLFDRIRKHGRLPRDVLQFYAAEIVCILEYLQRRGVLHRDLKPENLLLTSAGHLKLADFGSATVAREAPPASDGEKAGAMGVPPVHLPEDSEPPEERNGSFVGTAEYISPEALNSQPVSFECDLWALGCILFHMLEGRPPFHGASEYLTFQKVLHRDLSFTPETTDPAAKDIVEKILQTEPSDRLGSRTQGGFSAIKEHPFFEGVDWSVSLWDQQVPSWAAKEIKVGGGEGESEEEGSDGSEEEGELGESSEEEDDEEWKLAQLDGNLMKLKC